MEIIDLKNELIETLGGINKDKLSLYDLKTYAEILKIISDTHANGYEEVLMKSLECLNTPPATFKYPTIAEMKGESK